MKRWDRISVERVVMAVLARCETNIYLVDVNPRGPLSFFFYHTVVLFDAKK